MWEKEERALKSFWYESEPISKFVGVTECWVKRNRLHKTEFPIVELKSVEELREMTERLRASPQELRVVFRERNNFRFGRRLAALMWQIADDSTAYWINVLNDVEGKASCVAEIGLKKIYCTDKNSLFVSWRNSFGEPPELVDVAAELFKMNSQKSLLRMATQQRRQMCVNARAEVLETYRDFGNCVKFHMALELSVLNKAM